MSHTRSLIATHVRARLALAFPGARDLSASPFAVAADALPAYAVKLTPAASEPAGMGDPGIYHNTDRLSIFAWCEGDASAEANLYAFAAEVWQIVAREPEDLGGLVFSMRQTGAEVQPHPAEKRLWALEIAIEILYRDTPPAPSGEGVTAGAALGFGG